MPLKMMDKQKFLSKTEDDTMGDLTIRPINTGYVTMIPKQYLYHHSTVKFYPNASDQEEEYPVFAYLVEGGDKLLLIDTGMAYTERASKYHHHGSRQPEGMAIAEQLAKIGYTPEDIDIVVLRISTGIIASIWRSSQTRNSM